MKSNRAGMALVLAALGACAGNGSRSLSPPTYEDDPAARAALVASAMDGYQAGFVLTWDGARIGEARERFYAADDALGGYRFERVERVVVRRADAVATARTSIVVDVDSAMGARRVVVVRESGGARQEARAERQMDDGWRVTATGVGVRLLDGAAVPATLVPLYVAARGGTGLAFDGPVLVEGANLARADLQVDVSADGRTASARYHTAAGELRAVARLDEQGRVAEAGVGAMLASRRADDAELARSFEPPEIVDSTAIEVAGSPVDGAAVHLTVSGVKVPPPVLAELPGQTVQMAPGGTWDVFVEPTAYPGDAAGAWREVRERTHYVAGVLVDDLRYSSMSPGEALAAGRGDCTAHAIVLAQDLGDRGYDARLVTGFVLDDGSLHRHRWVVVRIGKRWVPVDPMFDEAPARPTHVALAVHGMSTDELAFVDDVVFAGWDGAIAAFGR